MPTCLDIGLADTLAKSDKDTLIQPLNCGFFISCLFVLYLVRLSLTRGNTMKERITVTVDPILIAKVKAEAERESRNFSNMISVLLKEALDKKAA